MNNSIITHFNRGASHYSDTARIQKRIALHLLDLVMQDLYSGRSFPADIQKKTFKSCLDLGCGPGVNFAELIQIADKVTGIDIAEEMIAKALQSKSAEELIALAKSEGFELTKDEAEAYMAELADVELDGREMKNVAGGTCYMADEPCKKYSNS